MSQFIIVHCIETREDVEIIQPFVINVSQIVLIEQEWSNGGLRFGKREYGRLQTKVYVRDCMRYVTVRETVAEIMSMIGPVNMTSESFEYLSKTTQQFVESNQVADDIIWIGDGKGGKE